MQKVNSYSDFFQKAKGEERVYLLLYKPDGEQSRCAYQNLEEAVKKGVSVPVFSADVLVVRDIHERFGINSVPSLLLFAKGNYMNAIKGCFERDYYIALLENKVYVAQPSGTGNAHKSVTVYSTPSCSWCNTLKSWLTTHHISYTDIDVSRDEKAAAELVKRTGQQGVPQTDINGQIVVGFDQKRLKELLEIN